MVSTVTVFLSEETICRNWETVWVYCSMYVTHQYPETNLWGTTTPDWKYDHPFPQRPPSNWRTAPAYSNIVKWCANMNVCFLCGFDIEDGHNSGTCPPQWRWPNHQVGFEPMHNNTSMRDTIHAQGPCIKHNTPICDGVGQWNIILTIMTIKPHLLFVIHRTPPLLHMP